MADKTTEHAVIATFNSSGQAEQAANDLLDWQKANTAITLGAIGVITRNSKGVFKWRLDKIIAFRLPHLRIKLLPLGTDAKPEEQKSKVTWDQCADCRLGQHWRQPAYLTPF